jgi:hypothetical protein
MTRAQLEALAQERSNPSVSISLNTHRTFPDCQQDAIALKNLVKEAENRLLEEFDKRSIQAVLDRLNGLADRVDERHNLDSLHLYVSANTEVVFRSPWPYPSNDVKISASFALRPVIQDLNRTETYNILLVGQSGVHLFTAMNDAIISEVNNDDFPFSENRHVLTDMASRSDSKAMDDQVREYLNQVDKALVRHHNTTKQHCVVVSTEDNYSKLMQVADKPAVYYGHSPVNYNDTAPHTLATQAWSLVTQEHRKQRASAIDEIREAVGQGKVITDLREIYKAAIEGRAELLLAHSDFRQAVKLDGNGGFDLVDDRKAPGVIDDITSDIAREVLSRKGRTVFTAQDELKSIGQIALKVRY